MENGKVGGILTKEGIAYISEAVVLSAGTFMQGLIHIGNTSFAGGRSGDAPSVGLSKHLKELGFNLGRLKTGTPPRVHRRSIDFSQMEEQKGDDVPGKFSFLDTPALKNQRSCHLTYTNQKVHGFLERGFNK